MVNDNLEVNEDVEKVEVPEEEAQEGDELVEIETTEQTQEEKETPSDSSTDEKPEPTKEESDEKLLGRSLKDGEQPAKDEKIPDGIVLAPGETYREYALRKEVERMKGKMRDIRKEDLVTGASEQISPTQTSKPNKEVLSKYDPQELNNLKEVLNVYADELGFVRKDEFKLNNYQQVQATVVDEFLKDHPEYLPENDADNLLWNHLKEEVSLYRVPEDPREYRKILNKAHSSVLGITPSSEMAKIAAQQEKLKSVSHPSGKGSSSETKTVKPSGLSPELRSHLKGFDEKELEELGL